MDSAGGFKRMMTEVGSGEGQPQKKIKWKAKTPKFLTPTEMVTFYTGEDEFACAYSPVLKTAFNSNFIEGQTQTYLEDIPIEAFRMLIKWFHTQKIERFDFADIDTDSADWETRGALAEEHSVNLVHLWIVADKLLIARLQNIAIMEIQACR
ncbi:hypothetical protein DL98DRAFT_596956 [Cadophora sp. DSE1049]|nr:hypothetical protein DL98DRAFT_596956 [Cadophora sp. DSE1049]